MTWLATFTSTYRRRRFTLRNERLEIAWSVRVALAFSSTVPQVGPGIY